MLGFVRSKDGHAPSDHFSQQEGHVGGSVPELHPVSRESAQRGEADVVDRHEVLEVENQALPAASARFVELVRALTGETAIDTDHRSRFCIHLPVGSPSQQSKKGAESPVIEAQGFNEVPSQ